MGHLAVLQRQVTHAGLVAEGGDGWFGFWMLLVYKKWHPGRATERNLQELFACFLQLKGK